MLLVLNSCVFVCVFFYSSSSNWFSATHSTKIEWSVVENNNNNNRKTSRREQRIKMPSFMYLLMKNIDTKIEISSTSCKLFSRLRFCCLRRSDLCNPAMWYVYVCMWLLFAVLSSKRKKKFIGFAFNAHFAGFVHTIGRRFCLNGFHSFVTWKPKMFQIKRNYLQQHSDRRLQWSNVSEKWFLKGQFKKWYKSFVDLLVEKPVGERDLIFLSHNACCYNFFFFFWQISCCHCCWCRWFISLDYAFTQNYWFNLLTMRTHICLSHWGGLSKFNA